MEIQRLELGGARVFAVSCACRVEVVVRHFARRETADECKRILDELWVGAAAQGIDPAHYETLRGRLHALPEASIEEAYERGYYAMRALGVVAEAITAFIDETLDGAQAAARSASDGAISLASDIAFEGMRLDDTRGLPELEEKFEADLIRIIESSSERRVEDIRRFCQKESWPVELLHEIDRSRGWIRVSPT